MALRVSLRSIGMTLERLERPAGANARRRERLDRNLKRAPRHQPLPGDAQLAVAPLLSDDADSVADIDLPLKSTPSEPQ